MERVHRALKEMVDTVNGDPPNGNELLKNASRRFVDLLEERREEFRDRQATARQSEPSIGRLWNGTGNPLPARHYLAILPEFFS